jgi:hypothetical protein
MTLCHSKSRYSSVVEHFIGNEEVEGSILSSGTSLMSFKAEERPLSSAPILFFKASL